ncbi:RNA-binding protein [Apibacter sp. B3889]|uniref:RNA recognition motif domain-containing protein n=1 Tax=unclassified Apibacter TaxID=2630820 RepID=UPI0013275506|nr:MULTISPECIES: RNA-binding protein [unclassified Apibacter]MXO34053.1 RNA-binding protein [Apibacter sp. B3883]MXO41816.1 RNA-binding protein [Apibacter sp. B3889]MXP03386.1 RNA-binding protein [Apibacter sp. B3887]MXP07351.1 RNA-binding protein [Apibacter sp. B3935]
MNIFISNLNYRLTNEDLHDLFSEYGEVESAKIIQDRETGRSRGFGFVEMGDAEAKTAIQELNQKEFDGKVINVSEARPRDEKPRNNFRRSY